MLVYIFCIYCFISSYFSFYICCFPSPANRRSILHHFDVLPHLCAAAVDSPLPGTQLAAAHLLAVLSQFDDSIRILIDRGGIRAAVALILQVPKETNLVGTSSEGKLLSIKYIIHYKLS